MARPRPQFEACYVAGPPDACWPWTGCVDKEGYGRYADDRAHRVMYKRKVGPIPSGLTLDHTCHSRACVGGFACPHRRCVNPAHLEPVTRPVNTHRGNAPSIRNLSASTCRNGHPRTTKNTHVAGPGKGRVCRVCNREAVARVKARRGARR